MLKKEILDALKKLIECLIVLVAIPICFVWDRLFLNFRWDFLDIIYFVLVATVVVYSIYSGATIFQTEKKDRAFEYLLSMPLTRMKIIIYKIFPRISILALMIIVMAVFSGFKINLIYVVQLIFLFLISASISVAIDSVIIGFIGVSMLYIVFFYTSRIISFSAWPLNIFNPKSAGSLLIIDLLSASLLLVPFGIAFWKIFKNLDVKPLKLQIRPYYYIALPALLIIISFIVASFKGYLFWLRALWFPKNNWWRGNSDGKELHLRMDMSHMTWVWQGEE